MVAYVALFRAVNVGGNIVSMDRLRGLFDAIGLGPARSLQAAGSLVFTSDVAGPELEARLEAGSAERLGLATPVLVRSLDEWRAVIAANPFPDAARAQPSRLLVTPLRGPPAAGGAEALQALARDGERIAVAGTSAYFVFPGGVGPSKLTPKIIERHLGQPGTGRNWNTALKLLTMLEAA